MVEPPVPRFEHPPLIETVLGVEFAPLDGWRIPHFGLFWQSIRPDYPTFEIQPPLARADEIRSAEDRILQAVMVEFLPHPPVRCWYIHSDETRLLQLQNDRFIHNWRKSSGDTPYPHYENIRPIFESEWKRFGDFLEAENIGKAEPKRCEVTYVNHLLKDREWNNFADLPNVFPVWAGKTTAGFLPSPRAVAINLRYPMPEEKGELTIQVQPAVRQSDQKEVLQLTLTAKGPPASPALEDVLAWFDAGRDAVVRAFADFTTPDMHKLWDRKV